VTSADELLQEKRQRARMAADRRRHGACAICRHRDTTDGVIHCAGRPDRQRGFCNDDLQQPRFSFDDTSLEKYR
jgi:hypothetical protein